MFLFLVLSFYICSAEDGGEWDDCLPAAVQGPELPVPADLLPPRLQELQAGLYHLHPPTPHVSHPTNELYPKQIIIYVIHFNLYFYREEEGKDLLGKRTMDFKVSYLDAGFATSYFDGDCPSPTGVAGGGGGALRRAWSRRRACGR